MVAEKNYYEVLGVAADASIDDIKKSFKKLARKHHPDAGGDEAKFKELSEAYEVLSDKQKREEYDTWLKYGAYMGGGSGAYRQGQGVPFDFGGQGGWRTVIQDFGDLGDIFSRIRHGEGAFGTDWDFPERRAKGRDVQVTLDVSFEDAFFGSEKRVTVRTSDGGEQKVDVKIPAGAVEGGKLRYKGMGGAGSGGGEKGDLVIVTAIKPHPLYSRNGANVLMNLPISFTEAGLGAQIVVPAPDGSRVKLRIPANTPNGKTFVLRGKGAPRVKGTGHGDLKVQVSVTMPAELNAAQKAALEAFAAASDPSGADIRPLVVKATEANVTEAAGNAGKASASAAAASSAASASTPPVSSASSQTAASAASAADAADAANGSGNSQTASPGVAKARPRKAEADSGGEPR